MNILYNLSKSVLVLAGVIVAHKLGLLNSLWEKTVNSSIIANANTIFNLGCALALLPLSSTYEKMSRRIVKDDPVKESKFKDVIEALNPVFYKTPALALQSCYNLLLTILGASRANIEKSFRLLEKYDPAVHMEIQADEDEIDRMTDQVSKYIVSFLPQLRLPYHVSILDQYYKVTSEFERLGDHAVNIASRRRCRQPERGTCRRRRPRHGGPGDPGGGQRRAHRGALPDRGLSRGADGRHHGGDDGHARGVRPEREVP